MTDGPDTPQTPARDDNDNADFGPTEETGEGGYPEETPAGSQPEGEGRDEQRRRDES